MNKKIVTLLSLLSIVVMLSITGCVSTTSASGISGAGINNITGNGHTVYYKTSARSALGGHTFTLAEGGYLQPAE